jgi:spore coat polysaccharide biosynthesis predicted glycosyltransferase SpsG
MALAGQRLGVLVRVAGGPAIGMGHVVRSLAIADELVRRGADVKFWCEPNTVCAATIEGAGFSWRPFYHRWDGDVVLFDEPADCRPACQALRARHPRLRLAALDYFDYANPYLGLIINLYNHHPGGHRPRHARYAEGPAYAIIRRAFDGLIGRRRVTRTPVTDIALAFGGSDPGRLVLKALAAARRVRLPVRWHVIIGPQMPHADQARRRAERGGMRVHEAVEIAQILAGADLMLTGSGTSFLEGLAVGTPVIMVGQRDREVAFARWFQRRDAALCLGLGTDVGEQDLAVAVDALARDGARRARMSAAGRRLVDGCGRQRVARLLEALGAGGL